jgi:branched-chain amino acid transport system ATP-binding protein
MGILETTDLKRTFGGLVAVDNLNIEIEENAITGLIGPNGAGKTTTFNLLSGSLQPDSGTIRYQGEDITGDPAYTRARKGLGRTYQLARLFNEMTVKENLMVVPTDADDPEAEAERLISLVELDDERDSFCSELSGGQKVLVGIIRMLMLQPNLILLDEPFAGVNPGLVDDIAELLQMLRNEEGVTILLIDHDLDMISEVCDDVIVMVNGEQLVHDTPEQVRRDERVISSYIGGEA